MAEVLDLCCPRCGKKLAVRNNGSTINMSTTCSNCKIRVDFKGEKGCKSVRGTIK